MMKHGRRTVRAVGLILGAFAMLLPAWSAQANKSVLPIASRGASTTPRTTSTSNLEPRGFTIFNPVSVANLIADINTANTNGLDDIIDLGGGTFILDTRNNTEFGYNGLPSVLSDSAHTLTIQNGTIERNSMVGTPSFRLLHISSGANLTLLDVTLTNGLAKGGDGASGGGGGAGLGGALFNQGSLSIQNCTINGNKAQGGNGGGGSNAGGGAGGLGGNGGDGNGNSNGAGGGGGGFGGNGGAGNSGADTAGGGGGTTGDGGTPTAGTANGGTGGTGNGTSGTAATGVGGGGGAGVGNDNGNGGNGGSGGVGGGGGGAGGGGGTAGNGGNGGAGGFGGGGGAAGGGSGSGTKGTGGLGGFGGGGGGTGAFGSGGGAGGGGFAGGAGSGTNGGGGAGLGGGVFNHGGTLTINNSTFSGNTAMGGSSSATAGQGLGGGVFNRNGFATINHATFASNIAAQGGGGIFNLGDGAVAILILSNTIVADSTGSTDCTSSTVSGGTTIGTAGSRNLIEGNSGCPGATVTTDPSLGPLQDNGGPTQTHALPAGSSALDVAVAGGLTTDQRGEARTSDDPAVPNGSGDGSDIGSFELIVAQSANLSITKADSPDPVLTGGTLTYTLTVLNSGPSTANNVVVTDNLPSQVTFAGCSSTGGGVCGGSGNNRTVTFASLANGASATITFTATVNCSVAGSVVINNTASISSDTSDPDSANNSSTAMTTTNNPAPTITCPANFTRSNDPNQCGAVVTYTTPTPSDNCAGTTVMCSPASGSFFPKGATTVTCTATDSGGAMANCTFTVTVNDTQPPAITCPANITKSNDPNQCGAVVNYPLPTVSDNCPGVGTPGCSPASGSFFPKGTTTVSCTVADSTGNTATCTFTVTVNDTQPPTITCPPNATAKTASVNDPCVVVTFAAPIASDNCPGVTAACTPASGSCFPVGTTTVTCTATDTSGNTATCSFTVTVFNVCLQDDSNPNIVFLGNTITGAYRFCCGGTVYTGVATVTRRGSVATFQHNGPDRRVLASDDGAVFKGTASLQSPPGTIQCTITDRNTANNSCVCQ